MERAQLLEQIKASRQKGLSIRTVERHITNIYGKIHAQGRADATAYAFNHGLAS